MWELSAPVSLSARPERTLGAEVVPWANLAWCACGRLTQCSQGHPGTSLRAYNNPLGVSTSRPEFSESESESASRYVGRWQVLDNSERFKDFQGALILDEARGAW